MIRVDKQDEAYLSSIFRLISFLHERERDRETDREEGKGGREEGKKSKCLAKVM